MCRCNTRRRLLGCCHLCCKQQNECQTTPRTQRASHDGQNTAMRASSSSLYRRDLIRFQQTLRTQGVPENNSVVARQHVQALRSVWVTHDWVLIGQRVGEHHPLANQHPPVTSLDLQCAAGRGLGLLFTIIRVLAVLPRAYGTRSNAPAAR